MLYVSGSTFGQNPDRLGEIPWEMGIDGLEAGFLSSWEDAERLRQFADERGLAYGIHIPLLRDEQHFVKWLPPLDEAELRPALDRLRRNMELAQTQKAGYAIIHIPSRMMEPSRWTHVNARRHRRWVMEVCDRLEAWSSDCRIPIHVEVDGPNPYLDGADAFVELVQAYPGLHLCLDILKIFFLNCWFEQRSWRDFVAKLAPYTASLHLQNIQHSRATSGLRLPPHPSQEPENGWLDVAWIIRTVREANPRCHLTLEHTHTEREDSYLNSIGTSYERYLKESITWIQSMLS